MKDEINNMDELFRGNLLNYEQQPPADLWNIIEKDISRNRKKFIVPLYFKIAASIVLTLGLGSMTWYYINSNNSRDLVIADSKTPVTPQITIASSTTDHVKIKDEIQSSYNKQNVQVNSSNLNTVSTSQELSPIAIAVEQPSEPEIIIIETDESLLIAEVELITEENEIISYVPPSPPEPIIIQEKEKVVADQNAWIIEQNILALADQNNQTEDNSNKWSIGGQAGPQYSYRYVDVNSPDPYLNSQNKNQNESPIFAYAGGLQIEVESGNRFSIQSGIYYSKLGHRRDDSNQPEIDREVSYVWDPIFGAMNYVGEPEKLTGLNTPVDQQVDITSIERFLEFVEVPFVLSYKILDKKLAINVSSGLWADFLVGNKAFVTTSSSQTVESPNQNINNFNVSASVGLGLNYPIMHNLNFSIDPVFKYYLSPINDDPAINVYPYTFGLMSGVIYTF
jgi:hypothetical protein